MWRCGSYSQHVVEGIREAEFSPARMFARRDMRMGAHSTAASSFLTTKSRRRLAKATPRSDQSKAVGRVAPILSVKQKNGEANYGGEAGRPCANSGVRAHLSKKSDARKRSPDEPGKSVRLSFTLPHITKE